MLDGIWRFHYTSFQIERQLSNDAIERRWLEFDPRNERASIRAISLHFSSRERAWPRIGGPVGKRAGGVCPQPLCRVARVRLIVTTIRCIARSLSRFMEAVKDSRFIDRIFCARTGFRSKNALKGESGVMMRWSVRRRSGRARALRSGRDRAHAGPAEGSEG